MPKQTQLHYVRTFRAWILIAYVFSKGRSGETPRAVLGGTRGVIVVDGYTGYHTVLAVEGRARAGYIAHVRRKLFDAREAAPAEVGRTLALILELYRVEQRAIDLDIVGTRYHGQMRREQGRPAWPSFLGRCVQSADCTCRKALAAEPFPMHCEAGARPIDTGILSFETSAIIKTTDFRNAGTTLHPPGSSMNRAGCRSLIGK